MPLALDLERPGPVPIVRECLHGFGGRDSLAFLEPVGTRVDLDEPAGQQAARCALRDAKALLARLDSPTGSDESRLLA